jgi:signal transduction histidine kinase
MPAAAFALGLVSMGLLISMRRIEERQAAHAAVANAVMDLRIALATSHLWTDEALASGARGDTNRAFSSLRESVRLSGVLRNGGQGDDGLVVPPATDADLRVRVEDLGRRVAEWSAINGERLRDPRGSGEGTAVENRADALFNELELKAGALETLIEVGEASDLTRSRLLFYGLFLAWGGIVVASTLVLIHRERARAEAEQGLQSSKDLLVITVAERTRELRNINERLNRELGELSRTEEALRKSEARLRSLSMALISAQERERRRISTELHDELGHALILIKLRLGRVAKELREDQAKARQDCLTLFGFIDQTIEGVRRLSRDLRPSVLDDLGLVAALRWLADNCGGEGQMVGACIDDVDSLLARNSQVVVYRIVQQALTNAARHSEAPHISLTVKRQGDLLSFVVSDDGHGFDVSDVLLADATRRGLGLATMQERALMVGGSLGVWSEVGKGTRITLGVPVEKGEST